VTVVPWEGTPPPGAPDQLPNFYDAVLTFERTFRNHKFRGWNITTTKNRSSTFWGKKSVPPEKILATRMRKPRMVWAPRMVIPARKLIVGGLLTKYRPLVLCRHAVSHDSRARLVSIFSHSGQASHVRRQRHNRCDNFDIRRLLTACRASRMGADRVLKL